MRGRLVVQAGHIFQERLIFPLEARDFDHRAWFAPAGRTIRHPLRLTVFAARNDEFIIDPVV
jgi:hypothetical protein